MSQTVIVVMIIAVLVIIGSLGDTVTAMKHAVDFEDMLEDGVPSKGAHIKGKPIDVWGIFATQDTVTKNKYGSTSTQKGTATFYVVPVNIDDEFFGIIGVKVGKANTSGWNTLYRELGKYWDAFYDGEDPGKYPEADFTYEGKVTVMKDSEMIRYFKKWMEDDEYEAEQMEKIPLYLIEPINPGVSYAMTFGGLFAIVICILITVVKMKGVKEAEEQAKREAERIAELQRENEMLYHETTAGSDMADTFHTAGTTENQDGSNGHQ